jgi:hypothetical protein
MAPDPGYRSATLVSSRWQKTKLLKDIIILCEVWMYCRFLIREASIVPWKNSIYNV